MLAREALITVIDFETTGVVGSWPNEPWQMGLVLLRKGCVAPETAFDCLLRVGDRPFNPHAPGKHFQRRDEIAQAPLLRELWPELRDWLIGRPLAAHNIGTEKKIIRQAAPLHKPGPWIDTLKVARVAFPELASHTLEDTLAELRLMKRARALCPGLDAHDALFDAFGSAVLLEYFLQMPGWEEVTVEDLVHAHPEAFHRQVAGRRRKKAGSI